MITQSNSSGALFKCPFVVGLTGGIASGKSTVSHYLAEQHAIPVIDTDSIARQLVQPHSDTLAQIVQYFGAQMVDEEGNLKRQALRNIIAIDTEKRAWLNALMHPLISECVTQQLTHLSHSLTPYVLVVIPLLKPGSHYLKQLNHVLVVDCNEDQQKKRLMIRDTMEAKVAQAIIKAQPSRAERAAIANSLLVNEGELTQLIDQAENWHQYIMSFATSS